uniref:Uncharacterized protein n=1 Tax=Aegilops tauschii subsp. strangulata TaxID=200361 RepID=A0A453LXE7_AEGTS
HPLAQRAAAAAGAGSAYSPARYLRGVHPPGVPRASSSAPEHLLSPRRPPRPRPGRLAGKARRRRLLLQLPYGHHHPGPKELLREQKRKSARFLLAPIAASRETLVKAQDLLASENASAADAEEVRGRLSAAGRDCVPRERNSVVAFQSRTGVEVCTFSLILKNAASLLDDKDPVKVEADASLAELIQSFSDLGTVVENSNFELSDDRKKMKDDLLSTISALDKYEQGVKDCLGV